MSSSISSITAIQPPSAQAALPAHAKAQPTKVPATASIPAITPQPDTIHLSTSQPFRSTEQRVLTMQEVGASVDQIAATLGLTTSEVESDLGAATSVPKAVSNIIAALTATH